MIVITLAAGLATSPLDVGVRLAMVIARAIAVDRSW